MASIRIPEQIWKAAQDHLLSGPGERVAFFLAYWTYSAGQPVFMVRDVLLIPEHNGKASRYSVELNLNAILEVINTAFRTGDCLIEAHNHGGSMPRFSYTDRDGLDEFVPYIHASLPGRPYAATVWGDTTVYGEYFLASGETGVIDRITVIGERLQQIVSRDNDSLVDETFDRQIAWFTPVGQQQIAHLRIAIVGCGGTGSEVIQNLVFLGCRDFVLIDNDIIDQTNFNRVVTIKTSADIAMPKVALSRRLIHEIAPTAQVIEIGTRLQSTEAVHSLKDVDVIFGCVDNDGARLILNEFALAYGIPLFDLAVGINAKDGLVNEAGGRVAVVWPDGPCLYCMNEIDPAEAAYFLYSPQQRADRIARGYVNGMDVPAPAVISLNAIIAGIAVSELCIRISGSRPLNAYTELDLLGAARIKKAQWVSPRVVATQPGCVQCAQARVGDRACIERYIPKPKGDESGQVDV